MVLLILLFPPVSMSKCWGNLSPWWVFSLFYFPWNILEHLKTQVDIKVIVSLVRYFLLWDHETLKGEKKEAEGLLLSNTHLSSHSQNIFAFKVAALKLLFNQPLLTARCSKC